MRTFRHWTPRYLFNRARLGVYELLHPNVPWLTPAAIEFLDAHLKASDVGLEFGSGRSTLWFARRVARLTSVEHDRAWYERVSRRLAESRVANVEYRLCDSDPFKDPRPWITGVSSGSDEGAERSGYVRTIDSFADASLNVVLIDGIFRPACALRVIPKLCPGGLLAVDNINWYLPCHSCAPNSRREAQGPASIQWGQFRAVTQTWQCLWTSSGVTDTAIYTKP
jgi:predicted O-methyltransferase YrrM